MREFDLIADLSGRLASRRADTRLGIGDDGAIIAPPPGHELVVTTDTLIAGRHFPNDTSAFDIGYKAIAVNLSDLAAMAATPAWVTLALSIEALDPDWVNSFIAGMQAAIGSADVDIIGGDTTRGPLSIGVTAIGLIPTGQAVRRDGARVGDVIAVTGALGDAAAGLALWPDRLTQRDAATDYLLGRLARPTWRQGEALRKRAHAAIDISDGLVSDLNHVLRASGVGAAIEADRLPCSDALQIALPEAAARQRLQLAGGDDYELCIVLPASEVEALRLALGCTLTVIGTIDDGEGLRIKSAANEAAPVDIEDLAGWDHFNK